MKKFYLIPILFSVLVLGGCSDSLVSTIKNAIEEQTSNNSGVTGGESGGVAGGNSGNVGGTGDIGGVGGGDVPGGGTSGSGDSGETGGGRLFNA